MALSSTPEAIWALQGSRDAFEKAMHAWERTVAVSQDELIQALRRFLDTNAPARSATPGPAALDAAMSLLDAWRPIPEPYKTVCQAGIMAMRVERESSGEPFGPVIAALIEEYGRTPEDWLWRTPENEIEMLLDAKREKKETKARIESGAADGRFLRAHKAFWDYAEMVKRLKKGTPQ